MKNSSNEEISKDERVDEMKRNPNQTKAKTMVKIDNQKFNENMAKFNNDILDNDDIGKQFSIIILMPNYYKYVRSTFSISKYNV